MCCLGGTGLGKQGISLCVCCLCFVNTDYIYGSHNAKKKHRRKRRRNAKTNVYLNAFTHKNIPFLNHVLLHSYYKKRRALVRVSCAECGKFIYGNNCVEVITFIIHYMLKNVNS